MWEAGRRRGLAGAKLGELSARPKPDGAEQRRFAVVRIGLSHKLVLRCDRSMPVCPSSRIWG